MKKIIVACLTGRSGSGKNYLCEAVKKMYRAPILIISEMLSKSRNQIVSSNDTVGSIMDRGEIVPTSIVVSLLEKTLGGSEANQLIINGFPRTIEQARFLETQNNKFKPIVFYLEAERGLCIGRVKKADNRGERSDDAPEKIIVRQNIFEEETLPAIKYLQSRKIVPVITLDGTKPSKTNTDIIMKTSFALADQA